MSSCRNNLVWEMEHNIRTLVSVEEITIREFDNVLKCCNWDLAPTRCVIGHIERRILSSELFSSSRYGCGKDCVLSRIVERRRWV